MKYDAFTAAIEAEDPEALTEALADDVVFRSPVVFKAYEGKPVVSAILTEGAMKVFEDFRYVERFEDGDAAALIFKARVGDREVDGLDLLRFDARRQGGGADGDGAADERAQRPRRGDGPRVRAARDRAARERVRGLTTDRLRLADHSPEIAAR